MEIQVDVVDAKKLVRLEVERSHTIGQIVEQIIDTLGLPRDRDYDLLVGMEVFGSNRYHLALADLSVKKETHLALVSKTAEAPPARISAAPMGIRIGRRKYPKYVFIIAVIGLVSLTSLSLPNIFKLFPATVTHTITATATFTPYQPRPLTQTSTPPTRTTAELTTDLFNFKVIQDNPNTLLFDVDYCYGPDRLPAQFRNRKVYVRAFLSGTEPGGPTVAASSDYECNAETKRGTAQIRIDMYRREGVSPDITVRTNNIQVYMYIADEERGHVEFFRKTFYYAKTWSNLPPMPFW